MTYLPSTSSALVMYFAFSISVRYFTELSSTVTLPQTPPSRLFPMIAPVFFPVTTRLPFPDGYTTDSDRLLLNTRLLVPITPPAAPLPADTVYVVLSAISNLVSEPNAASLYPTIPPTFPPCTVELFSTIKVIVLSSSQLNFSLMYPNNPPV